MDATALMAAPADTLVPTRSAAAPRRLSDLARGEEAIVARVEHDGDADLVADRLEALGLVPGEPVRVVATGPFGGEPRVVLLGSGRFALRRAEAARVCVRARLDQDARGG